MAKIEVFENVGYVENTCGFKKDEILIVGGKYCRIQDVQAGNIGISPLKWYGVLWYRVILGGGTLWRGIFRIVRRGRKSGKYENSCCPMDIGKAEGLAVYIANEVKGDGRRKENSSP